MNYANVQAGAVLVDCSSEVDGCEAANILDDSLSSIWLSSEGMPQWICVSLLKLQEDSIIRSIGWHCWHPYSTNPKVVVLHVSPDGQKFKVWDTLIVPVATRGRQLFICAPINTSLYPYIALEIVETFGGTQTYMNRIFLYSDEVISSPSPSRNGKEALNSSAESALPTILSVSMMTQQSGDWIRRSMVLESNKSLDISSRGSSSMSEFQVVESQSVNTEDVVDRLQVALGINDEEEDFPNIRKYAHSSHSIKDAVSEQKDFDEDSLSSTGPVVIHKKLLPGADSSRKFATPIFSKRSDMLPVTSATSSNSNITSNSAQTIANRIASLEHTVSSIDQQLRGVVSMPHTTQKTKQASDNQGDLSSNPSTVLFEQKPLQPIISNVGINEGKPPPPFSPKSERIFSINSRMENLEEKFSRLLDAIVEQTEKKDTTHPVLVQTGSQSDNTCAEEQRINTASLKTSMSKTPPATIQQPPPPPLLSSNIKSPQSNHHETDDMKEKLSETDNSIEELLHQADVSESIPEGLFTMMKSIEGLIQKVLLDTNASSKEKLENSILCNYKSRFLPPVETDYFPRKSKELQMGSTNMGIDDSTKDSSDLCCLHTTLPGSFIEDSSVDEEVLCDSDSYSGRVYEAGDPSRWSEREDSDGGAWESSVHRLLKKKYSVNLKDKAVSSSSTAKHRGQKLMKILRSNSVPYSSSKLSPTRGRKSAINTKHIYSVDIKNSDDYPVSSSYHEGKDILSPALYSSSDESGLCDKERNAVRQASYRDRPNRSHRDKQRVLNIESASLGNHTLSEEGSEETVSSLVQQLYSKVLQRTLKQAQMKILEQRSNN